MIEARSIILLVLIHVLQTTCTPLLFNYITPRNCSSNPTAYFDSLNLQCRNCNENSIADVNHLHCICPSGTILVPDGTCRKCEQNKAVSTDGHFCVECPVTGIDTQCPSCPLRYFTHRKISTDGIVTAENCIKCPSNHKVSSHGDTCIPCMRTDSSCECQDGETCEKVEEKKTLIMIETENGSQESSSYIAKNIRRAIRDCGNSNSQACQHLANICVLQNYRTQQKSACTELRKIINSILYKENGLLIAPTLFFNNNEGLQSSADILRETSMSARFTFDPNYPNSILEIILIQYSLNGTFLGMVPLSESNLNTCSQQKEKFHFGTFYRMHCNIQLQHLLHLSGGQPIFSDLYIVFRNKSGQKQMHAIPIINENIRLHGEFVNRLTPNDYYNSKWILTRRLYFVDAIMLDATSSNTLHHSAIVRFPEKIEVHVHMQSEIDKNIIPPYVRIRYAETERNPEKQISQQFSINYFMDESQLFPYIKFVLLLLIFLSFICSSIKAYSWGKRSGRMVVDGLSIIKLLLYECEILSDIFLFCALIPTIFTILAYKMQQTPQYVTFNNEQEKILLSYILVAMILKIINLLHCCTHLILTRTFFIDWERPRVTFKPNNTVPVSADIKEDVEITEPVIWRTYLVANEWNELQQYRKTSVTFQMIAMITLLHCLKLENWSALTPGLHTDIPTFTTSTTLNELAIIGGIYLFVSLTQWFIRVTVAEQLLLCPFYYLVDLCSISNISIFVLTHPLHGYYIHGRSVHDQADTDMITMNQYLQQERENLCGTRGLETGSALQTYIINLPNTFLEQFNAASQVSEDYKEQLDKHATTDRFDIVTSNIQINAKKHKQLNNFLMKFIEHNDPKADYIINDASLLEMLFDIEFVDSSDVGNFIRDKSEMAYSGAFVYGNEWTFLSFELSLFCSVYMFTRSYTCSAFITFIISVTIQKILSTLSTNHLIKSSCIDHRFLF